MDSRTRLALPLLGLVLFTAQAQPPAAAAAPDTPPQATNAGEATPQDSPVELLPGDEVRMEMFGHPEITTEAYVASNGTLRLPLVGPVQVGSLSPAEASKHVEQAYESGKYFKHPQVTLLVTRSPGQVSVLGEVKNQNRYPIEGHTTVIDVLAMAGDRTPRASDTVVLLRKDPSGKMARISVDLKSLPSADEKVPSGALTALRNGDILYVPVAPLCFVEGEVHKPESYRLEPGMTVERVIALAGGVTDLGNTRNVDIERLQPNGDYAHLHARLTDPVQAEDIITVREKMF